MLFMILGSIVLLVIVVLAFAASRPDSFRVERQIVVNAPAERLFALIEDFHQWGLWSPWEKLDPQLKRTHSGPPKGVGATYAWEGNPNVGSGRMEILEAAPPSRVLIKLDFLKPFEAHNRAEFTLTPEGEGTRVLWAMTGAQPFPMKVMGLFMSMDSMVGKDFEKGLAAMKGAAEA
jgi:uncharacterized protein YndB with AHSA1/START domain